MGRPFSLFLFLVKVRGFLTVFGLFVKTLTQLIVFLNYFCRKFEINLVFLIKIIIIDSESL